MTPAGVPLPTIYRRHLLLFTKYPTPGFAKTRLIPTLGADGAAALSRALSEHALGVARAVVAAAPTPTALTVWYAGGDGDAVVAWLGPPRPGEAYRPQPDGDLGARFVGAFAAALGGAAAAPGAVAVVMGADIPGMVPADVEAAYAALEGPAPPAAVLGPAADGGFYLLGVGRPPDAAALAGPPWGGGDARSTTAARLGGVVLGRVLRDVDEPVDVEVWAAVARAKADGGRAGDGEGACP